MNVKYVGILTNKFIKDTNELITKDTIAVIVLTRFDKRLNIISPFLKAADPDRTQDKT